MNVNERLYAKILNHGLGGRRQQQPTGASVKYSAGSSTVRKANTIVTGQNVDKQVDQPASRIQSSLKSDSKPKQKKQVGFFTGFYDDKEDDDDDAAPAGTSSIKSSIPTNKSSVLGSILERIAIMKGSPPQNNIHEYLQMKADFEKVESDEEPEV